MHREKVKSSGLIFTCEHGGNQIPIDYKDYFQGQRALLNSHRGYDFGALALAKDFAKVFSAPLVRATISRLLVDLNRSIDNPTLHFDSIYALPEPIREQILSQYYYPYRQQTEQYVKQLINQYGQVIHCSSHSFTPVLDGDIRQADIGLLYNPSSMKEAQFCEQWEKALKSLAPKLVVRHNYPYLGTGDSFPSWFRKQDLLDNYIGIELEVNQKHIFKTGRHWPALRKIIIASFTNALNSHCLAKNT